MKLLFVVFAVTLVALVMAEDCPNNDVVRDCDHMVCPNSFHRECIRTICTCTANDFKCSTKTECANFAVTHSRDCTRSTGWHCVDNLCRCGGRFGS